MRPGDRGASAVLALTAAVALVYGVRLVAGPVFSPDSFGHSAAADALLAGRFHFAEWDRRFLAPVWMYLGWIAIVALAKLVAGAAWPWAIAVVNWLSVATTAYLVLSLVDRLTRSRAAVVAAGALMLIAVDWLQFAPFVLADMTFAALSTVLLVSVIRPAGAPFRGRPLEVLAAAAILFLRPAAAPVVAFWILARLWLRLPGLFTVKRTAIGCAGAAVAAIVAHSWLVVHSDTLPASLRIPRIASMRPHYSRGVVIYDRPNTYAGPATTVAAVASLTLRKWVAFFWPWLSDYSTFHKLLNAAFFLPAYVLFTVGVVRSPHRRAILSVVLFIAAVSGFHAVQDIDPDHRYRMPILSALVIGAALGVASLGPEPDLRGSDAAGGTARPLV